MRRKKKKREPAPVGLLLGIAIVLLCLTPLFAELNTLDSQGADIVAHTIDQKRLFPQLQTAGNEATISMTVGTIAEHYNTILIAPGTDLCCIMQKPGTGDYLTLTIIIPDDLEGHVYNFEVRIDNQVIHRRSGNTRGFGKRTFFILLPSGVFNKLQNTCSVEIINHSQEPLYVAEFIHLFGFGQWLEPPFVDGDFILSFLIDVNSTTTIERLSHITQAPGVQKAISTEIYYANQSEDALRLQMTRLKEICVRYNMPFVGITCSWWAGTPLEVGQNLEFQQICWSDTDTFDEGKALRKLLGDRWDIRYGLTTPNMWSNTPWQTMNNPELNRMRYSKVGTAIKIMRETLDTQVIACISENEPAYWAFETADEHYPVKRTPLWADFNPFTVADARKDGVILDPSDGLDIVERIWLQYNLAKYNQASINALHGAGAPGWIYSHALLAYEHFPLWGTGHARPYAEVARLHNARVGVEMLWHTDLDAIWRVREWGRWANVNREECDGWNITYHIAMLQACYIMGADMLNSYNWAHMGAEGDPIVYFNAFLECVSNGGKITVAERLDGKEWFPVQHTTYDIEKNESFPWCNAVGLRLRCKPDAGLLSMWLTSSLNDNIIAYRVVQAEEISTDGMTIIDLGDITQLKQKETIRLHLSADSGWEIWGSESGADYRIICVMFPERRRSLYVIEQPEKPVRKSLLQKR